MGKVTVSQMMNARQKVRRLLEGVPGVLGVMGVIGNQGPHVRVGVEDWPARRRVYALVPLEVDGVTVLVHL